MRLLVIGGTEFVGRAVVEAAVDRGHDVTVFHRGATEPADLPTVRHVHGNRDGGLHALEGRRWDAALDTCAYVPRQVHEIVETLAGAVEHYGFVSTLSVYPDELPPGGTERSPVHPPPYPDTEEVDEQSYGPLKVACEHEALAGFSGRCLIVRPGYIVGPHDPTDRFTYWVLRTSLGGETLAPAPPGEALQVVDVRDLAAFTLDHLEARTDDVFGVVGPDAPLTWEAFLRGAADVAGSDLDATWVDGGFLRERLGEDVYRMLPLWDMEWPGLHRFDAAKAVGAGLRHRPIAVTVTDTLAWVRGRDQDVPMKAGLTFGRERELLAEWHARGGSGSTSDDPL
jgi:2'-hydroxyisoflavone reductase